jgi:penicillin-binding protein 1C
VRQCVLNDKCQMKDAKVPKRIGSLALSTLALLFIWACFAMHGLTFAQESVKTSAISASSWSSSVQNNQDSNRIISFEAFKASFQPTDLTLLDRRGLPIGSKRIDMTRRRLNWVALEDVSPALIEAVLTAEDRRFFEHDGVDWTAVAGAVWERLDPTRKAKTVRGASTITMQVAAFLDANLARKNGPRSLPQKWTQLKAAIALEQQWKKAQILEAYFNIITYRGELEGLQAASWGLFETAPSGLNKSQSALLAALLRAPNASPAMVAKRACLILRDNPSAVKATCEADFLALQLEMAKVRPQPFESIAPHASNRLLNVGQVKQGNTLTSSLDASIQRMATKALRDQLSELANQGASDGAVVVLNNATGEVLAYVGSGGRFSKASQVDAAASPRQAGSTLKPFLYALAFDQQLLSPASLLEDSELQLSTDAGLYTPSNYNEQFTGPVSVRHALASSLNIPAVRTITLTSVEAFYETLQKLQLSTLHPQAQHYGYSLALGSADLTLLDLTNAYRSLANGGRYTSVSWTPLYLRGTSKNVSTQVFSPQSSWLIANILSDNSARFETFGFDSVLATPFWSAVKTGTSKDMRDNWCLGFTEKFTVGVWVGNAGGSPMRNVSGVSGAAPVWAEVMRSLHQQLPSREPLPPSGLIAKNIRFEEEIEPARREWFLSSMAPSAPTLADGSISPPMPMIALSHNAGQIRIVYPSNGSLIAIDPDIPNHIQGYVPRHSWSSSSIQQLDIKSESNLRWQLNGIELAPNLRKVDLVAGKHTLTLLSEEGKVLDQSHFEIRGKLKSSQLIDLPLVNNGGPSF